MENMFFEKLWIRYIGTILVYSYTKLDMVPIKINVTNNIHKMFIKFI